MFSNLVSFVRPSGRNALSDVQSGSDQLSTHEVDKDERLRRFTAVPEDNRYDEVSW
jgi:hypothetical protein